MNPDSVHLTEPEGTPESLSEAKDQRDSLLVALRNLVTSVKRQHNLPEALIWADEAIVKVVAAIAIEEASL